MNVNLLIGKHIREVRLQSKTTQAKIASLLGISQNMYSKIETGKTTITLERLIEISAHLDVDIKELLKDVQLLRKV